MAKKRGKIYNKVYTPELWEQVNEENKEILEDWIAEYRQQKKSPETIKQYYNDARIAFIYILQKCKNKCILNLTKKDFRNYSIWLSDECGMSANRVNRLKATINSMLTFCEEDDSYDYDVNLAKKVKGLPKVKVKTDEDNFFFTFEEFIKVRDILVERGKLQHAVLWSIGFDSAGRRNELYQIKKEGLTERNKTNKVVGKRGKEFPLCYLDDTRELIGKYLAERGEDEIESLWYKIGKGGEKEEITKEALYDRMLYISDVLSEVRGEDCNIFCHTMRHARVECLLQGEDDRLKDEDGKNRKYTLDEVMVLCHHSDVSTTQGYSKNHDEDKINAMFGF